MSDIKITPGNWRLYELDRKALVDENDDVIADIHNWQDTDDGVVLTQVPQMLEVICMLTSPRMTWSDPLVYEVRKKAQAILEEIQKHK